jgi:outer membrane receptor for monomeric catechols
MSVSAVSGDYLEEAGIADVAELAKSIPSLSITQSNNSRNSSGASIRGIGTSATNPGIEQSVGIFIDGVCILAAGPIQGNLQDVNAVEVLRGPQGTLYGRNTPVGAVNITTRAPTQAAEKGLTIGISWPLLREADQRIYRRRPVTTPSRAACRPGIPTGTGMRRTLMTAMMSTASLRWAFAGACSGSLPTR